MVTRRTAIVNPDTSRTEYGNDANGNLTSKLSAHMKPTFSKVGFFLLYERVSARCQT